MKIGLIQSRGIGDIIIALPIGKYFADRGHKVLWPIYEEFVSSFSAVAPYIEFLPIARGIGLVGWYETPFDLLKARGCDQIITLYHYLRSRPDVVKPALAESLKFDEYKYAVAGVPFREKWNLDIVRDRTREEKLYREVADGGDFVVCHLEGHNAKARIDLARISQGRKIVEINSRTDSIFDWLAVIERASLRIMIDSCFSNLTDQLKISGPKIFLRRSPIGQTPVLSGDWNFLPPVPYAVMPSGSGRSSA